MGNSIVRAGKASADKREYNDNVEKAIQNGATRQDATRQELERRGVVFNDNGQPTTGGSSGGGNYVGGSFDDNGKLSLQRFTDGVAVGSGKFSLGDVASLNNLRRVHEGILDFAGRDLSSNTGLLNLSQNCYNARVDQQAFELSQPSQASFYRNRRYAIGNAAAARQFDAIGVSGFNVDLNDDATRARVAGGIAAQTKAELTNIALGIASLPLLAVGGGVLGSLAFRGAQVGIRGVQATSRAVTSFTDDVARLGTVNAIGLRAPTATIYGAEALAGLSEGGIYAASFGTVATSTIRYGDGIVDAVGFGNRISNGTTSLFHTTTSLFHTTTSPIAAQSILDRGIDPNFLNPNSRFGAAFYVAEGPGTNFAELAHDSATPSQILRMNFDSSKASILVLTDPAIARAYNYTGGPISSLTQQIGVDARQQGFDVIRFYSERDSGGINNAVLANFNDLLTPHLVK